MIYYLLFISIFTSIFFFTGIQSNKYKLLSNIQENWSWNKDEEIGTEPDPRIKINPASRLNAYKLKEGIFLLREKKYISFSSDILTEFPILGKGYVTYKKIGDKVSYFSSDGEILWEKPYKSYPKFSPQGDLALFISGDGNQILIGDINGNSIGKQQLDGRFLTDISYPVINKGALILFSGGEYYKVDHKGNLVFKYNEVEQKDLYFYKSASISPNAKFSALHFLKKERDYIILLNEKGEKVSIINLEEVYPHKLFIATSDDGITLVNSPSSIAFYSPAGKIISKISKKNREGVYQIAFFSGKIFIASFENYLYFFDSDSNLIRKKEIDSFPARILPSNDTDSFFLETAKEIISFQVF